MMAISAQLTKVSCGPQPSAPIPFLQTPQLLPGNRQNKIKSIDIELGSLLPAV
jgi:hypothetical protein